MKYIRTKEHIYKRLFIDRAIINECGYGSCDKDLKPAGEIIIKESDNLEELCDEFVVLNPCENNYPMLMTGLFPDIKHNLLHISYASENKLDYEEHCFPSELPLDKADVYGAIWTDKGLIYVAKMNEKGELELL